MANTTDWVIETKNAQFYTAIRERVQYKDRSAVREEIAKIPPGRDLFQRNLMALEFAAAGRMAKPSPEAIQQLYADAKTDLASLYPQGGKMAEIWAYVLESAKTAAESVGYSEAQPRDELGRFAEGDEVGFKKPLDKEEKAERMKVIKAGGPHVVVRTSKGEVKKFESGDLTK